MRPQVCEDSRRGVVNCTRRAERCIHELDMDMLPGPGANRLNHKRVTMVDGSRGRDVETATTWVQAAEGEDKDIAAWTKRYECLFPVDMQGTLHMRTKGMTLRKMGLGRASMARLGRRPCGQGLHLSGREVYHLGAILDLDVQHEKPAACG